MRKFFAWLKKLFTRNKKIIISKKKKEELIRKYEIVAITSGKRHVWVETRHGRVRKPIGEGE